MNPKKRNRHWKEKKSSLENAILEEKTKRQISKTILEEEISLEKRIFEEEEEIVFRKHDIEISFLHLTKLVCSKLFQQKP